MATTEDTTMTKRLSICVTYTASTDLEVSDEDAAAIRAGTLDIDDLIDAHAGEASRHNAEPDSLFVYLEGEDDDADDELVTERDL